MFDIHVSGCIQHSTIIAFKVLPDIRSDTILNSTRPKPFSQDMSDRQTNFRKHCDYSELTYLLLQELFNDISFIEIFEWQRGQNHVYPVSEVSHADYLKV